MAMLRRTLVILLLPIAALLGCAGGPKSPSTAAVVPSEPARRPVGNPWAESTREVLIEHCGDCHLGTRPSARARALAVYDLARTPWQARLKPQNYEGLLRRVNARAKDEQKQLVAQFVRCERDGICAQGEPPAE
jgi:hypothetical protein